MRWVKHMTATRQDERVAAYMAECGSAKSFEGYGFYWGLLEIVASHVENGSEKCSASYPLSMWAHLLSCHHHTVSRYLKKLSSAGLITLVLPPGYPTHYPQVTPPGNHEVTQKCGTGNIEVIIPNLLKYRDEYSRKSGQTPDSVRSKEQKQIQIQKKSITKPASATPAEAELFDLKPTNGKPKKAQLVRRGNPGWPEKKWAAWVGLLAADPIRQKCSGARDAFGKRVVTDEDAEWVLQAHARSNRKELDPESEFSPSFVGWLKSALDAMETGMKVEDFAGVRAFTRPRDVI